MATPASVNWLSKPSLRNPTFVSAFTGWNDAADAASSAVRHLIEGWSAVPLAEINPEPYTDFATIRPQVRLGESGERKIIWPTVSLWYVSGAGGDIILSLGPEPSLQWKRFSRDLLAVAERAKIQGEAATAQAIAAHQLPSLREAEIEAAAALQRLRLAREQLDQEEARARQRAVELERRAEEFTRDLEREKLAVSDSEAALARLLAEAETLIAASDTDEAAEIAREKLAVLEDELAAAEQALGEAQSAVSDINAQRAAAERALREEKDRVVRFRAEQEKLQHDLALIEETHGNAADLMAMAEEIEALEMASMEADDRAQAARAAHAEARER